MKKFGLFLMIIICWINVHSLKNWKTYTNTTHIFDTQIIDNKLYSATWGGMLTFNLDDHVFEKNYTIIDGLTGTDIRALHYDNNSDVLLIGTSKNGVNRFSDNEFLLPITTTTGLLSDKIKKVIQKDSLIFIATDQDLSVFLDNQDFPFPLLIDNYSTQDGLSSEQINSIQISSDDILFLGTDNGLDIVHLDSMNTVSSWYNLNVDNSMIPGNEVSSISLRDNKIALGTDEGIALIDLPEMNNWTIYNETDLPDTNRVFPVFLDSERNLWFSFGNWNDEKLTIDNSSDLAIIKISEDGSQTIWMKDENGLTTSLITGFTEIDGSICAFSWGEGIFILENNNWQNYKQNSISANIITDIEIDQNNKLWVANGYYGLWELSKGTQGISCFNDGIWEFYTSQESPLKTNNVLDIEIDQYNKKWFACWQLNEPGNGGVSVFDDVSDNWQTVTGLSSSYFTSMSADYQHYMWLNSHNKADIVNVVDLTLVHHTGTINLDIVDNDGVDKYLWSSLITTECSYFGFIESGICIWNNSSFPETYGNYWQNIPFSDLHNSAKVFDIKKRETTYTDEIWIASSNGLFMFDGDYWYQYGTVIKKKIYYNNSWTYNENDPEYLYIGGENPQEKLYGAASTYPTALFVDPFNRIWIGTQDNGITLYQPEAYYEDEFTNITKEKYPLLSNTITSFAYEPDTGTLYVGTDEGLNSFEIGIAPSSNKETKLRNVVVYPNPFHPAQGDILRIENLSTQTMPKGDTSCSIYDLNGDFVIELQKDYFQQFQWDGLNSSGYKCGSGIYFYVVHTDDGQIARGKFALIR